MSIYKKIGITALLIGLCFAVQFCSSGGDNGVTTPTEGFSFYLDFNIPMDTSFPEGSQVASVFPFSISPLSAHATGDPHRHLILMNVSGDVGFNYMKWQSSTRMLVNFQEVPSTIPIVYGALNPQGKVNGFTTAQGALLPPTTFEVPNDNENIVPMVQIQIKF